ncbi:MAG: DUF1589 domain-containing protein, partial [Pseudomonas sp.]|nr:DUF1589 domain-containing protein [Pseudomonas sp.]
GKPAPTRITGALWKSACRRKGHVVAPSVLSGFPSRAVNPHRQLPSPRWRLERQLSPCRHFRPANHLAGTQQLQRHALHRLARSQFQFDLDIHR